MAEIYMSLVRLFVAVFFALIRIISSVQIKVPWPPSVRREKFRTESSF